MCSPCSILSPLLARHRPGELPGGKVASVMLSGEQCQFPAVLQGYDTTADWIRSNGYEQAGPPREIWHSTLDESERLEVAWPFR